MANRFSEKGFTLLEVMIALVIFSIGLIGLAGLQAVSLENNQIAYSRTMATILAYDMADRIRNNRTANYDNIDTNSPPTSPTCTGMVNCTTTQMVTFDHAQWAAAITLSQNNLLNARGVIDLNGTTYTIMIGWNENKVSTTPPGTISTCADFTGAGYECIALALVP